MSAVSAQKETPSSACSGVKTQVKGNHAVSETVATKWLEGVSHQPKYTISAVTKLVGKEFPALSISKVRYFEKPGILKPSRSASGYRKYSDADVERLRYALALQRDFCLPLHKIAEQIEDLESGANVTPRDAVMRLIGDGGKLVYEERGREGAKLTLRELLDVTGISRAELDAYGKAELVRPDMSGLYSPTDVNLVSTVKMLCESGLQPSHFKMISNAASRVMDLLERAIAGTVPGQQPSTSPKVRAKQMARVKESAAMASRLFEYLIVAQVEDLK